MTSSELSLSNNEIENLFKTELNDTWKDYLERLHFCETKTELISFIKEIVTVSSAKGW